MAEMNGMIITEEGLAEVINAEQSGTGPVVLTHIAFGTGQYTPTGQETDLQSEFTRFSAIAGGHIGDNVIHLTVNDDSSNGYTVYEVGVYSSSGTLFAVYSQTTPVLQKAAGSQVLLAIDIVLTNVDPETVTVGDTTFVLNPATTTLQGIVELATNEETIAGADATRAVTPASLNARTATTARKGLIELATAAEAVAATDGERAITPFTLAAAFVNEHFESGFQKLPNGFLLQWGKALIAQDGTTRITFPTAFPAACAYAGAISTDNVQPSFSVSTMNAAGVNFKHNGNGGVNAVWLAIGY